MSQRNRQHIATVVIIPLLYVLILYILYYNNFGDLFALMTCGFLFLLPFCVGALTIFVSDREKVAERSYRIFMPWIPISIFCALTLIFAFEGWACILMAFPLFLLVASVGGVAAGHFKLKDQNQDKTYISLVVLLPLLFSPAESLINKTPDTYKAYTVIDIHASKADIWQNVTRVQEISAAEDKGQLTNFLGFPRPLKAELNYEGVGAFRKAIFSGGLVFHETVTAYEHQKKMTFSIKADPYDIPSTTMDKHVVIGGDYFDVKDGTYELEVLNDSTCRLHLYSHYTLTTNFNFYARWWAGGIMKDIQDNILQVVKKRAEKGLSHFSFSLSQWPPTAF